MSAINLLIVKEDIYARRLKKSSVGQSSVDLSADSVIPLSLCPSIQQPVSQSVSQLSELLVRQSVSLSANQSLDSHL